MNIRKSSARPPSLGEELLELAHVLRGTFSVAVAPEGLTYVEGRVLRTALRCSQQAEIVDMLRIAPSSLSAILNKLERMELLARASSNGDRRQRSVVVTPKGEAALRRVFERLDNDSPLMTRLTSEERATLCELVTRVLDH